MITRPLHLLFIAWFAASLVPALAGASGSEGGRDRRNDKNDKWDQRAPRDRDRDAGPPAQTEVVTRTVQIGAAGELELSNMSGDIAVTGTNDRDMKIVATKQVREADEADARRQLALLDFEVVQRGPRVEVRTDYPRGIRRSRAHIDYDIAVPAGTRVTLRSISGDIRANGVKGELRIETVSGSVQIGSAGRLMIAKAVSGDVAITNAAADGDLTLGSVSGNVLARGVRARGLDVETVSGDLTLTDVTVERAGVRTVSGTLEFAGPLARKGRYDFASHSGDVRLTLAGDTGFELQGSSFSGEIQTDVPITQRGNDLSPGANGRQRTRRNIQGVYGDGSALVEITTFSGDIVIGKKR